MKKNYFTLLFLISLFWMGSSEIIFGQPTAPTKSFNVGFSVSSTIQQVGAFYNPYSWYFPEVFRSANSASTYIYTKAEIGGKGKLQFFKKMAMPFAVWGPDMDLPAGYPVDFWDYYFGMESTVPTPVQIYFRNVQEGTLYSSTSAPVDISESNGWVKVWDGVYNYFINQIDTLDLPEWGINNGVANALAVEFTNGFIYTGGDIQIVIKSGVTEPGTHGDWDNWDFDIDYTYFNYPFLCYRTVAGTYPANNFPGTRWAASYFITDWNDWWDQPVQGENYYTGSSSQYTLNLNGIRPMARFTKYVKMEVDDISVLRPDVPKIDEYNYNLMRINITTEDTAYALKAKKITISTVGTTASNIVSAKLYATGNTPEFEFLGAIPIGEYYFDEGIPDQFEINIDPTFELGEGNNYFWLVYEIPTTNNCGDLLYANLEGVTLVEFNNTDGVYPLTNSNSTSCVIDYAPVVISPSSKTSYSLCNTPGDYTLSVDVSGAIDHEQWERSTDNLTWETIIILDGDGGLYYSGNDSYGRLTISKDPQYKFYRYSAYGPEGCENSMAQTTINIIYNDPIGDVSISYDGLEDLDDVSEGTVLVFNSNIGNVPPAEPTRYVWQIDNGAGWQDISTSSVPSAATPTLELIANTQVYFGRVRLLVEQLSPLNPDDCQLLKESTNSIAFSVSSSEFFFTEQPAKKIVSCPGGSATLQFAYYGNMISGSWYKDGVRLENSNQIFKLTRLTPADAGSYYFAALVSTINEDYESIIDTIKTRTSELFILDKTSIFKEPESVEAPIGGVAVFQTIANHSGITPPAYKDSYQWYKLSSTGVRTPLVDNYKYKGTKSNILVISYLEVDDYTYNGAGYYCVVTSACDHATTKVVTLLPTADDIIIQNQPVDVAVCQSQDIKLSVRVRNNVAADYQWYKNNTALIDDGRIQGATTADLVIEDADNATDAGQYWVKITKPTNPNIILNSNKVDVKVNYISLVNNSPVDIKAQVGEDVTLEVELVSTTDYIEEFYKDGILLETNQRNASETKIINTLQDISPEFAGLYKIKAYNNCGEFEVEFELVVVDENGDPLQVRPSTITENADLRFNISPNPTAGNIIISFDSEEIFDIKVEVLDLKGAKVGLIFDGQAQSGTNKIEYDLRKSNLTTGTYFIKVTQGANSFTKQIVLTK